MPAAGLGSEGAAEYRWLLLRAERIQKVGKSALGKRATVHFLCERAWAIWALGRQHSQDNQADGQPCQYHEK
jgi:hypothetical protein